MAVLFLFTTLSCVCARVVSGSQPPSARSAAFAFTYATMDVIALRVFCFHTGFLFSVANKAGKTVQETAKQLKTTVEENVRVHNLCYLPKGKKKKSTPCIVFKCCRT